MYRPSAQSSISASAPAASLRAKESATARPEKWMPGSHDGSVSIQAPAASRVKRKRTRGWPTPREVLSVRRIQARPGAPALPCAGVTPVKLSRFCPIGAAAIAPAESSGRTCPTKSRARTSEARRRFMAHQKLKQRWSPAESVGGEFRHQKQHDQCRPTHRTQNIEQLGRNDVDGRDNRVIDRIENGNRRLAGAQLRLIVDVWIRHGASTTR